MLIRGPSGQEILDVGTESYQLNWNHVCSQLPMQLGSASRLAAFLGEQEGRGRVCPALDGILAVTVDESIGPDHSGLHPSDF